MRIVEDELSDTLQLENVFELLVVADRHSASKLKNKAIEMIVKNKKQVENLVEWSKFVETYPKLTVEIFKML